MTRAPEPDRNAYRGPVPRRLTAEQFLDAVWQLTGAAPEAFDAPIERPVRSMPVPASPVPADQRETATPPGKGRTGEHENDAGDAPGSRPMVRASLLKSDFLMRSLGRPNRDQIVSMRPTEFTTLEAIDLANGEPLIQAISQGAPKLLAEQGRTTDELLTWLYRFALSRQPTDGERELAREVWGTAPSEADMEDLLWAVIMLPEFQWIR
jgi:hypothetical protein